MPRVVCSCPISTDVTDDSGCSDNSGSLLVIPVVKSLLLFCPLDVSELHNSCFVLRATAVIAQGSTVEAGLAKCHCQNLPALIYV